MGKERRTAQEGGSDKASSDTASHRPKTISIGIGAIVVFVLTALVLSVHKRRDLLDVIDDLGVFVVSLLVTTVFLLVAILIYFVAKKTLWDLLQLLIVPLALAAIGFWFAAQQDFQQQQIEEARADSARKIEEQRAQDAVLQAYLDQMSQLMLEGGLGSSEGGNEEVRILARARTQTVLTRLDSRRRGSVVQFLYEASLIEKDNPVVSLSNVGLRDADLSKLVLSDANLSDANLSGAILNGAILNDADLSGANLIRTNLSDANLSGAILSGANLQDANLSSANLNEADLGDANLTRTNLSDANLSGADLEEAFLVDVRGVTKEDLEDQTDKLKGTTMPGGNIHP